MKKIFPVFMIVLFSFVLILIGATIQQGKQTKELVVHKYQYHFNIEERGEYILIYNNEDVNIGKIEMSNDPILEEMLIVDNL